MKFTNPHEIALFSVLREQIAPLARERGDSEEQISIKAVRNMDIILNEVTQTSAQDQYETARKALSISSGV